MMRRVHSEWYDIPGVVIFMATLVGIAGAFWKILECFGY